ncbi:hypothetical protein M0R89_18265 [Halorussus limi]|uniref:Uncharacterized protein n=1 Tax=Halorussus limi TaxID=2938695 RepID=A0A8U0HTN3_9EURY|nr:hypothetical protein [Halorussus limi]UPV74462.1 hypothetical protein M0R89_18265 [Halorussus limi]
MEIDFVSGDAEGVRLVSDASRGYVTSLGNTRPEGLDVLLAVQTDEVRCVRKLSVDPVIVVDVSHNRRCDRFALDEKLDLP